MTHAHFQTRTAARESREDEISASIQLLKELAANPAAFAALSEEQRIELLKAAGQISRPNREEDIRRKKEIRGLDRKKTVAREREARAATGIRSASLSDRKSTRLNSSHRL